MSTAIKNTSGHALLLIGPQSTLSSDVLRTLALFGVHAFPSAHAEEAALLSGLCQDMLRDAGQGGHTGAIPASWFSSDQAQNIEVALPAAFSGHEVLALSDIEISRLVPFWRKALANRGYGVSTLCLLEDPQRSCEALQKTRNCTEHDALLFWLNHMLISEQATRDLPRLYLTPKTDEPILGTLSRIAQALNVTWPKGDIDETTARGWSARHMPSELAPSSGANVHTLLLREWVETAHAIFTRWAAGDNKAADHLVLDGIYQNLTETFTDLSKTDVQAGKRNPLKPIEILEQDLAQSQTQLTKEVQKKSLLDSQLAEALGTVASLQHDLAKQHEDAQLIHSLESELEAQRDTETSISARLQDTQDAVAELQSQQAVLQADLENRTEELRQTKSALEQRRHEVDDTHQHLQDLTAAHSEICAERDALQAELAQKTQRLARSQSKLSRVTQQATGYMQQDLTHILEGTDRDTLLSHLAAERSKNTEIQSATAKTQQLYAEAEGRLVNTREELAQVVQKLSEAQKDLSTTTTVNNELQSTVAQREEHIARLFHSTSWRITAPMRAITRFTKRISKK